jgi:DNA-binding transcriptional MerR regulator
MNIDSFSAKKAARICGFDSVYMIDYLQRSGVFIPSKKRPMGHGKRREYSFKDLVVLKTISTLLKNGASVAVLKKSLLEFQSSKWDADKASMQFDGAVARYMVASGSKVFFAKSGENLFDLTQSGQMVFSFIVDLDNIHKKVVFEMDQGRLALSEA